MEGEREPSTDGTLPTCGQLSGGFRGGSWGSMEPPFGLDLVQRSTGDRLTGTPLSGLRTTKPASVAHLSIMP